MSSVVASGSSRSAGSWACRRPPTTSEPPVSGRPAGVEDERLLELIREIHRRNYFAYGSWRMWKALQRAGEEVGRGRVETADAQQSASRAPNGAASRGAQPSPTPMRCGRPTWSSVTSRPRGRTSSGSRTSPTCAAGTVSSTSRSCSTPTAAPSSAGSSPLTCAPTSSSTPCGWRSPAAGRAPTSPSYITATRDRNTPSNDYTQTLDDHGVLASIGSVGDAYDNALAESFVDSFKTELIRDRVWRTRSQLELAVVEYVAWFNTERLHTSLGGVPPAEYEKQHARR